MTKATVHTAVIGAGPYGLSVAAHLKGRGVSVRIFGTPMLFWKKMPESINLKSFAFATNVYVPQKRYTFPEYCRARGLPDLEPCTMKSFSDYGVWVQKALLPELEETDVADVASPPEDGGAYRLRLATGEELTARTVVVATGLSNFESKPPALAHLPREVASHSSEHTVFDAFKGKRVAVIGAGASALESATLVLEAGGDPLLIARESALVFHGRLDPERPWRERIKNPITVLGPGKKQWVLQHMPLLLRDVVPEARRVRFTRRYLGPAGPWWLIERFEGKVPHRLRTSVTSATERGGRVDLGLIDDAGTRSTMTFDHVIAGTGFEADVDALPFLSPSLKAKVRRIEKAPALSRNFESSVRGLYFAGPAAALSFGPLFRFVAGAEAAAPRVARHVEARA